MTKFTSSEKYIAFEYGPDNAESLLEILKQLPNCLVRREVTGELHIRNMYSNSQLSDKEGYKILSKEKPFLVLNEAKTKFTTLSKEGFSDQYVKAI